ncbi:MAG TPA: substrate-binding domain-containing protein, partial [Polyangiaceae bacterium]|nr:substrate-binding domain-containing protein [Polyangiaceae bacterium]
MSGRNGAANAATSSPRVLVILSTGATWSRGVLRGFATIAHEHGWTLLHYQPDANVSWLADEWAPAAVVVGPGMSHDGLARLARAPLVSVAMDRSREGIASVCPHEEAIGVLASDHLLATGLRRFSTFRLSNSPYLIERERAFVARALATGAKVVTPWGSREEQRTENPAALLQWLRGLEKPCGIFTCTDRWGALVARYARVAGLRVPEDLALVGADNDSLECDLIAP